MGLPKSGFRRPAQNRGIPFDPGTSANSSGSSNSSNERPNLLEPFPRPPEPSGNSLRCLERFKRKSLIVDCANRAIAALNDLSEKGRLNLDPVPGDAGWMASKPLFGRAQSERSRTFVYNAATQFLCRLTTSSVDSCVTDELKPLHYSASDVSDAIPIVAEKVSLTSKAGPARFRLSCDSFV